MFWFLFACQSPVQPDVVLVVVDTLRADRLKIHGNSGQVTPVMNSLADEGIWFSRAFAQSGWTLPSFVSLWTGKYPHEHRVGRNPLDEDQFGSLPDSETTLAELFKGKGYATGAVINNTFMAPEFGVNQGFDAYNYVGADNSNLRLAKQTSLDALSWLNTVDKPAFMVVHYMEPHMHLDPPSATRGKFLPPSKTTISLPFMTKDAKLLTKDPALRTPETLNQIMALYDEEVLAVDQGLEILISGIKKRGKWDNTLFVLTSDHGEEFWDHGGFEHGHTLFSELTHIPLIAVGPGLKNKGESKTLVEHVDLFQGLLAAANIKAPEDSRGEDLFSIDSRPPKERWSISENTLYGHPLLSVVTPRHRLIMNQKTKTYGLWNMDDKGWETDLVSKEEQESVSNVILDVLIQVRGHLDPIANTPGPKVPTQATFQQLRSLGYISE